MPNAQELELAEMTLKHEARLKALDKRVDALEEKAGALPAAAGRQDAGHQDAPPKKEK